MGWTTVGAGIERVTTEEWQRKHYRLTAPDCPSSLLSCVAQGVEVEGAGVEGEGIFSLLLDLAALVC